LPSGLCYVETANLDGETNLKVHESLKQTIPTRDSGPIHRLRGSVDCEAPNNRLYVFQGALTLESSGATISVSNKNLLLRGCVVRNVPSVIGVVVYTVMCVCVYVCVHSCFVVMLLKSYILR
jgi:magnesium-transporting ATPase (P-type)